MAQPQDDPAVRQVLEGSYPLLMAAAYEPAVLARALPLMTRPNPGLLSSGSYYVAEAGGTMVGCGGWSLDYPGREIVDPTLGHIRHFATLAAWIGQGIGRAVYDACEADALRAGVRRFECQASVNGEPFYAALGFRRIGQIELAIAPDVVFPSIWMTRDI